MQVYKELYYYLFNQISDALEQIDTMNFGAAKTVLITAQQEAEERFLSAEDSAEDKYV